MDDNNDDNNNNNNNNNNNKQQATSNKQQATSNNQQPTSNKQQATSNKQQATSNKQQATWIIVFKHPNSFCVFSFPKVPNSMSWTCKWADPEVDCEADPENMYCCPLQQGASESPVV